MQKNKRQSNKLFYGDKEIGFIDATGCVNDIHDQKGINPIIEVFPFYLYNSLPEGERYETLLLHSPHPIHSPVDAVKNVDELPGKFFINSTQNRVYTPFPDISDNIICAETSLPELMFFPNSEARSTQKPSFSGYQDKFTAKTTLLNGKLMVSSFDPKTEYGNTIVKPGLKRPGIAQNEFVCMKLAEKANLEVPRTFLLKHPGQKLSGLHFCVERFDLTKVLPFEKKDMLEFASLMKLTPESKYSATTEELFQCAEKHLEPEDVKKLASVYFFGILTGNGDMHTKNFSVFVDKNGKLKLTPIYDMVNTKVHGYPDMLALPFGESCNPNPQMRNIIEFLELYINKDEMYHMAQIVKLNLSKVLELVFSEEKNVSFSQSLEKSILDCVDSAKKVIEKEKSKTSKQKTELERLEIEVRTEQPAPIRPTSTVAPQTPQEVAYDEAQVQLEKYGLSGKVYETRTETTYKGVLVSQTPNALIQIVDNNIHIHWKANISSGTLNEIENGLNKGMNISATITNGKYGEKSKVTIMNSAQEMEQQNQNRPHGATGHGD